MCCGTPSGRRCGTRCRSGAASTGTGCHPMATSPSRCGCRPPTRWDRTRCICLRAGSGRGATRRQRAACRAVGCGATGGWCAGIRSPTGRTSRSSTIGWRPGGRRRPHNTSRGSGGREAARGRRCTAGTARVAMCCNPTRTGMCGASTGLSAWWIGLGRRPSRRGRRTGQAAGGACRPSSCGRRRRGGWTGASSLGATGSTRRGRAGATAIGGERCRRSSTAFPSTSACTGCGGWAATCATGAATGTPREALLWWARGSGWARRRLRTRRLWAPFGSPGAGVGNSSPGARVASRYGSGPGSRFDYLSFRLARRFP